MFLLTLLVQVFIVMWIIFCAIVYGYHYLVEVVLDLPSSSQSPSSTQANLKKLIEQILKDSSSLPNLENAIGPPSGDQVDGSTYEDLLATAILNKVINRNQRSRFGTPIQDELDANETRRRWRSDKDSSASVSSLEEFLLSDSSLCSTKYVDRMSLTIQQKIEEVSSPQLEFQSESDSESYSSLSTPDSNWFFRKNDSLSSPSPVPMLVPNPEQEAKILIGDRHVEDTSDLSDVEGDFEESEVDFSSNCVQNVLVKSKLTIGGKNPATFTTCSDVESSADSGMIREDRSGLEDDDGIFVARRYTMDITIDDDNIEDISITSNVSNCIYEKEKSSTNHKNGECVGASSDNPEENGTNEETQNNVLQESDKEFEGNYSKKDKEKWSHPIEMDNNPYSREKIEERIRLNSNFPRDEKRRKEWVQALKLEDQKLPRRPLVCSNHFDAQCFTRDNKGFTYVKKWAVPTLFRLPLTELNVEVVSQASCSNRIEDSPQQLIAKADLLFKQPINEVVTDQQDPYVAENAPGTLMYARTVSSSSTLTASETEEQAEQVLQCSQQGQGSGFAMHTASLQQPTYAIQATDIESSPSRIVTKAVKRYGSDYYARQASLPSGTHKEDEKSDRSWIKSIPSDDDEIHTARPAIAEDSSISDQSYVNYYDVSNSTIYQKTSDDTGIAITFNQEESINSLDQDLLSNGVVMKVDTDQGLFFYPEKSESTEETLSGDWIEIDSLPAVKVNTIESLLFNSENNTSLQKLEDKSIDSNPSAILRTSKSPEKDESDSQINSKGEPTIIVSTSPGLVAYPEPPEHKPITSIKEPEIILEEQPRAVPAVKPPTSPSNFKSDNTLIRKIYSDPIVRNFALINRNQLPVNDAEKKEPSSPRRPIPLRRIESQNGGVKEITLNNLYIEDFNRVKSPTTPKIEPEQEENNKEKRLKRLDSEDINELKEKKLVANLLGQFSKNYPETGQNNTKTLVEVEVGEPLMRTKIEDQILINPISDTNEEDDTSLVDEMDGLQQVSVRELKKLFEKHDVKPYKDRPVHSLTARSIAKDIRTKLQQE